MNKKIKLNEFADKMSENYLFKDVSLRVKRFKEDNPGFETISLGVGDVPGPLCDCVIKAAEKALSEQRDTKFFRGYGPEEGYDFARKAVAEYYERKIGAIVSPSDVFVGDGAKSAIERLLCCFSCDVVIPAPAYPAYKDCATAKGLKTIFLPKNEKNGFVPLPDGLDARNSLIVLCSPDNPTGIAYDEDVLSEWVNYALRSGSVILFDNAYERFVTSDKPRSIYTVKGAEKCAIEVGSLSKSACFTGMRFGWTIIPDGPADGAVKKIYTRILGCGYNGAPYCVQRAAEAALSDVGFDECEPTIKIFARNAAMLKNELENSGATIYGGSDSPYLWMKCPGGRTSFETFEYMLSAGGVIVTPGSGFGTAGEGFVRISALSGEENVKKALNRIKALIRTS